MHCFDTRVRPPGGAGQHLMPWPNRIRDGRYRFDGADMQLSLSEPDRHNAMHGLVRVYQDMGRLDDAIPIARMISEHDPEDILAARAGLSIDLKIARP